MLSNPKDEIHINKGTKKKLNDKKFSLFHSFFKFFFPFFSENQKTITHKQVFQLDNLLNILKDSEVIYSHDILFLENILQPLIKQGERIREKKIKEYEVVKTQEYTSWVQKANHWINIIKKNDMRLIQENVKFSIVQSIHKIIMKDMSLIKNYKDSQLENLELKEEEKELINSKIGNETYLNLKKLNDLYLLLLSCHTEKQITELKNRINEERELVFEKCLCTIDKFIEQEFPLHTIKNVNQEMAKIIDEIIKLEYKVSEIEKILSQKKVLKKSDKNKLNFIYQKAYHLSLDIRLTEEMFDRIKNSIRVLENINKSDT